MRINWFSVNHPYAQLADAVKQIMALFQVAENQECHDCIVENRQDLSPGVVSVQNRIENDGNICVSTQLLFRSDDGSLQTIYRHASSDCTAETPQAAANRLVRLNLLDGMRAITGINPGPWGILRGVRPTKRIHRLLDQGMSLPEIRQQLNRDYGVDAAKIDLIIDIALRQNQILSGVDDDDNMISIYIGIPYCPSRCLYCSFPGSILPEQEQVETFLRALEQDMDRAAEIIQRYDLKVQNIYIGGGTPTSLHSNDFAWLLDSVTERFVTQDLHEFTVEAGRPDSITDGKIKIMEHYGITRISVNPQTMQQKTLKLIGRMHTVHDIINIFGKIRSSGIPVINMDIIAGLPGETIQDMRNTLEQIYLLGPDNLTVHTLALKKGSALKADSMEEHKYFLPDSITTAAMLNSAGSLACKMDMQPYYLYRQKYMTGNLENIGYTKPGAACLYNIQSMEERQIIIGIGPAAATKAVNRKAGNLTSCYNAKDVTTYIKNLDIYLSRRQMLVAKLFDDSEEE
ncbi:MAG: coproporphyrinogen dehydrogenase HemZ [Veillonellales bacterium]